MKTDPRKACPNEDQLLFWAFIHDFLSHPFMAITGWCRLALRFHDWTSHKAWPRCKPGAVGVEYAAGVRIYRFAHPNVSHDFITTAIDERDAQRKADAWFANLSLEFGGEFAL